MLDQLFRRPRVRDRIRANVLGDWIGLYIAYLHARGHPPGVIQQYAQAVEHLGAWLRSEHIALEAVTRATIASFLHDHLPRCQCPTPAATCLYQVRAALAHLPRVPGIRLSSAEPASARDPADVAVEHYVSYLRQTCGQRGQAYDDLGRVAEGRIEQTADAMPQALRQYLRGKADQPGERDESQRREHKGGQG